MMFLILGTVLPSSVFVPSVEAGVSPEGINRRRKPRCRNNGNVVVCKMPRKRRCTIRRPCIPRDYYRPVPVMPLR